MSYCTECGSRVGRNAPFCTECGFDLKPGRASEMGDARILLEGEKGTLCPFCGQGDKLRWSTLNKSWVCDSCGNYFQAANLHKIESGSEKNIKAEAKPKAKAAEGFKETSEATVTVGIGVPIKSKTEPNHGTTVKQPNARQMPKDSETSLLSNIYSINAFRVLQVSVVASAREIASHIRKLDLEEKLEHNMQEEGIYPLVPPPDGYSRRLAAQRLNDPVSRIIDEIFWFWPINSNKAEDEDIALTALKQGTIQSAVSIWESNEAKGSDSIMSAHNLAILNHITALDLENVATVQPLTQEQIKQKRDSWEQALLKWKAVINSDDFLHWMMARAHEIGDRRLSIDNIKKIREDLPAKLLSINAVLAREAALAGDKDIASYHIALMIASCFNRPVVDEAMRCVAAPIRERIDIICVNTDYEVKEAPQNANKVINRIMDEISQLLITLDTLLPEEHPTRESAHDEIALLMKRSQIAYVNATEDWRNVPKLLNKALTIAASESVRQNIKDFIEIANSNLLYTTCWFCNRNRGDDNSVAPIKMHGNISRTSSWSGTEVRFHKITIPVPRCTECKSAHNRYKAFVFLGGAVGALGGFGVCVPLSSGENWYIGVITLAICVCIGLGIGYALGRPSSRIKPESSKKNFPEVKRMQSEGWSIGEKPT